ncbi:hypothetical protein J2X54_001321 [Duganella sp. 3397]|uniref:P-loop ATPase, Sll1717 family n=1 Tax=Duganella sp. 3397 TaxID=2817732 RepID=UPI00285A229E|nr:P-loop NTPase fold protein [Duganella sp. 3397]MDR7048873.1 hypothetical protein [Duganella sp. 3397]
MDAESDVRFLNVCFFDTGDLGVLIDCDEPKRIVLGRVGVGKSALLSRVRDTCDHAYEIRAEDLALGYIANSDIIQFFETAGVKLDLFYQLLWRHLFVMELLKRRYKLDDNESLLTQLKDIIFLDPAKKKALEYFEQWNGKFWSDTETRVKEFTTKLEDKLSSSFGGDLGGIQLTAASARQLSEEIKGEIIHKAQSVVNENQVRALSEIIAFLAEDVFTDPQKRFYLVIDRLDDAWVDDRIRYKLIRALIETVKAFQRVRNVKIIVAVREDLLRKVFDETKDAGFQEEKYASLLLRLRWRKQQLSELVDLRIDKLVREQYTQRRVKFDEVFRAEVRNQNAIDYVLDRTLLRPRDVISFVNCCIELSEGKEFVAPSTVQDAERNYSLGRLRSLHDEWAGIYPNLELYCEILRGKSDHFKIARIDEGVIVGLMGNQWSDLPLTDPIGRLTNDYLAGNRKLEYVVSQTLKLLYTVSAVGIKNDTADRPSWSYLEDRGVAESQFKGNATVYIHPMLWRSLDITPPTRNDPRKKSNRN